jgi:serine/threonine-protein phosphatase Stp1
MGTEFQSARSYHDACGLARSKHQFIAIGVKETMQFISRSLQEYHEYRRRFAHRTFNATSNVTPSQWRPAGRIVAGAPTASQLIKDKFLILKYRRAGCSNSEEDMSTRATAPLLPESPVKWWRLGTPAVSAGKPSIAPLAATVHRKPSRGHPQLKVASAAGTHRGLVRELNEDAVLDAAPVGLWAVADGVGGADAGDRASMAIVETLSLVPRPAGAADLLATARAALDDVNRHLLGESRRTGSVRGIASTVACLLIADARFFCLWAGDSRLYRWRQRQLQQISRDHTQVQSLVDHGVLTAEEAIGHPNANAITHAVGIEPVLRLDCVEDAVVSGDRFLLCSDGLTKVVSDAEIALVIELLAPREAVKQLIQMALDRGAPDNVSVVAVAVADNEPN